MKLAFVILQYMAAAETLECIQSIKDRVGIKDYKIIVVDNASPDDSYQRVEERYGKDPDVILLGGGTNLGFARGNNVGYQYALRHYSPEYIILMNNDILLIQDNIYGYISDCYQRYGFAVLGPMIMTKDGRYTSSPLAADHQVIPDNKLATREMMESSIREYKKKILLLKLHLFGPLQRVSQLTRKKNEADSTLYFRELVNYRLHGAFMIFSKRYQEMFPNGLDDRTFMYDEEYLLQYHVLKAGMKMVYSPKYCIYHKEDASSDLALGKGNKKQRFILENNIKSRTIYLETIGKSG